MQSPSSANPALAHTLPGSKKSWRPEQFALFVLATPVISQTLGCLGSPSYSFQQVTQVYDWRAVPVHTPRPPGGWAHLSRLGLSLAEEALLQSKHVSCL